MNQQELSARDNMGTYQTQIEQYENEITDLEQKISTMKQIKNC